MGFDFNPTVDQRLIRKLTQWGFIEEGVSVLIVGPCGTGKAHIAQPSGTVPFAKAMT